MNNEINNGSTEAKPSKKIFELFPNSMPDPKINACASCQNSLPMMMGDKGVIYCSKMFKLSWHSGEKINVPMCDGNPDFIPENIERIKY